MPLRLERLEGPHLPARMEAAEVHRALAAVLYFLLVALRLPFALCGALAVLAWWLFNATVQPSENAPRWPETESDCALSLRAGWAWLFDKGTSR